MKKGVYSGSTILVFMLFSIIGTFSALLVLKSAIYMQSIGYERYLHEQHTAAARALCAYGMQWVDQEIHQKREVFAFEWHGNWWPETNDWKGSLYISPQKNGILIKAVVYQSSSSLFTCIDTYTLHI